MTHELAVTSQTLGLLHCVSVVQVVLQPLVVQPKVPQFWAVPALQLPVPLHVPVGVNMLPLHMAVPHETVLAASAQFPPAAHLPVKPHGGAAVH